MKLFVTFVSLVAFIDAVATIYTDDIAWSVTTNFGITIGAEKINYNVPSALMPVKRTAELGDLKITPDHFCRRVCEYVSRRYTGPVSYGSITRHENANFVCVREIAVKCAATPSNVYIVVSGNQYNIHVNQLNNDWLAEGNTLPPAPEF